MDTDLLPAAAPTGQGAGVSPPMQSQIVRVPRMRTVALFAAGLVWLAIAAPATAALRIADFGAGAAPGEPAVVVDGRLDDPAWRSATRIELAYENNPGDNTAAGVRTTALMFHTGDALYLAFRAEDPDPAAIRAFLRDRDALYEDDFVGTNGVRVSHP
jgi:hypothetical protein